MVDSQKALASSNEKVAKELIIAEYNNLYAVMLKRLDIRYQVTQFALTALGAFLTIGLSVRVAILIYTYPAFVFVLSITYVTNTVEIRKIRRYIAQHIEPRVQNESNEELFGWHRHEEQGMPLAIGSFRLSTLGNVGAKFLLLLSAVTAVVIGKLAALLYGSDSVSFFWLACVVTVLEAVLLFGVEYRLSSIVKANEKTTRIA